MPGRIIIEFRSDGTVYQAPSGFSDLSEGFEGTGYENAGWVEVLGGGTVNEDYTSLVYDGSQALRITSVASAESSTTFTFSGTATEVWLFVAIRTLAFSSTVQEIIKFLDASDNIVGRLKMVASNDSIYMQHGTVNSTNLNPAAGYFVIWIRWKIEVGVNDGEMDLYYASGSETRPGSPNVSITTGDGDTPVKKVVLATWDSGDLAFDKLRVSENEIGSDPS